MRVDNKTEIKTKDTGQTRAAAEKLAPAVPLSDKVSIGEVRQVEAIVQTVRSSLGMNRAAKLQELETSIRQGTYQPDAGRLAEKIIQAAEVDARIRAIFGG